MISCSSFTLPLNQLVLSVNAASNGSKAISSHFDVWVLVDDVPPTLRSPAFLMAFGVLIGKPIEVDPESLLVLGPTRSIALILIAFVVPLTSSLLLEASVSGSGSRAMLL